MERIQNPSPCPFCKRMLEGHHSPEKNQTPSPGNATVCIHCGEFLEFDEDLQLIEISSETLVKISGPDLMRAKRAIDTFNSLRRLKAQMAKVRKK